MSPQKGAVEVLPSRFTVTLPSAGPSSYATNVWPSRSATRGEDVLRTTRGLETGGVACLSAASQVPSHTAHPPNSPGARFPCGLFALPMKSPNGDGAIVRMPPPTSSAPRLLFVMHPGGLQEGLLSPQLIPSLLRRMSKPEI